MLLNSDVDHYLVSMLKKKGAASWKGDGTSKLETYTTMFPLSLDKHCAFLQHIGKEMSP